MGTLYTSQSASGYNSNPPPDDGSQGANNQITWGTTIKAKLADPVKALADAINSQLTTTLDLSPRAISTNDSAVASDHWRTLQVTGTTTITLSDAATMTSKYVVGIANLGTNTVTVTRATGGNTVNGAAADFTLQPKAAVVLGVNQAANGYNVMSSTGIALTSLTTTVVDSGSTGSLSLKTNNGLTEVTITNTASAVNSVLLTGAATGGFSLVGVQGGDANGGLVLQSNGTSGIVFKTAGVNATFGNTQLSILDTPSATRSITVTGSNGGNPTIGTTAGSLAITPSVVIAGATLSIGTNPASSGAVALPYASNISFRNGLNSADVQFATVASVNGVNDIIQIGQGSGKGHLIQVRSNAGAPTTSDITNGFFAVWRDSTGATTKLYYNNAGTMQSVALA